MLRQFISIVIANLMLIFAQSVAASSGDELTKLLDAVQTMQADFTQTVFDNNDKAVQKSYGVMAMQRPGKFRWDVKKPMPQLIIANASRIWIYDRDLDQVTIRSLKDTSGESPALMLSHDNSILEKAYTVNVKSGEATGWRWFTLAPKNPDNMFSSVELGFLDGRIKSMRLKDHLGHATQIDFSNIKINPTLSQGLFTFKAPKNTDVIDETQ